MDIVKIKKGYVSDDCLQYMEECTDNSLTIISDKIVFNKPENGEITYSNYQEDTRRYAFPYHNIPTHVEKDRDKKIYYINQLYDFNKKYIVVKNGSVSIKVALRDEKTKEGILISEILEPKSFGDSKFNLSKYDIINIIKSETSNCTAVLSNEGELLNIDKETEKIDKFNKSIICIKSNGNSLAAKNIKLLKYNNRLSLVILKYPIKDYSIDDIDHSDKIEYAHEPKIKRWLNPSISKDAIISSKTMSRMLNN